MNWKGSEGNSRGLIHGTISWLKKPSGDISQDSRYLGRDSRQVPPRFIPERYRNATTRRRCLYCVTQRVIRYGS